MRIAAVTTVIVLVACGGSAPTPEPTKKDDGTGTVAKIDDDAGAAAPKCIATGTTCVVLSVSDKLGGCCAGDLCIHDLQATAIQVCARQCNGNTQCASGCCKMLADGTASVCVPASYCAAPVPACGTAGQACAGSSCCSDHVCVSPSNTCAGKCGLDSECVSGCCALLGNSGQRVCSAPVWCGR